MPSLQRLQAWWALSRPEFHTVGILPYALGSVLARYETGSWDVGVMLLGALTVILVMLSTYYAGEYYDYEADEISAKTGKTRFSGGTQVLQAGRIPRAHALYAARTCMVLAAALVVTLVGLGRFGPYALLFVALGILAGFFYSSRPVQWAYRGAGEIWIAFGYGWLTVAAGYYVQTGTVSALVYAVALPCALTVFNLIVINEMPDYAADQAVGKRNLVVRLGREAMARVYALACVAAWIAVYLACRAGVPQRVWLFYAPVWCISAATLAAVLAGFYRDRRRIEWLCAGSLVVNLGTALSLLLALT